MLVEALHLQTGLPVEKIQKIADSSSRRYRTYYIPKRNGSLREINHPGRELKAVQRWLVAAVLDKLPVHDTATAYKSGASIRQNANIHLGSMFTLRMDFRDFFPSFNYTGISRFLREKNKEYELGLNRQDIAFSSKIFTKTGVLTIGAPSSPPLTNVMMYEFDERVSLYCAKAQLRYSRYADDMYVSAFEAGKLQNAFHEIVEAAREYSYANLVFNVDKTKFLSRKYKRTITGLVLTPDNKISIGRNKKREIKSLLHRYSLGQLSPDQIGYLQGYMSYVSDVEPSFLRSMEEKYGEKVLRQLFDE